ncbi:hypothetical protein O181_003124 [Austropuccinia psidii MF-1]|uniref:Reverse transcriptase Ty1/copia-type domain-containing protein n=1 Tax=Austropuccinia psidii MF-1 TaxID=1389203 RepID=A0A9Q3BDJ5_9BASI|nr:hypothetical protein [Austropuccinia psidii MF-1]
MRLLDTTWVFCEKTDAQGNLIKEKARLCVRGFLQVENIDFHETFSPTGRLANLRFLLGYCASHDLDIQQMDVKTAFLHGDLDEEIYIPIPDGYSPTLQGKVCLKLKQSLYGLRQSPRNCTEGDPCFVFLHVDDLVIGGRNLTAFKARIKASFDMKDLGDIKYVLGMKVTRDRSRWIINLSQELYIENMLVDFGMEGCRPVSTPQVPSSRLIPTSTTAASINYQRAVGLLNYLVSCTRPDIAYAVSCLAQFLNNPSKEHEIAFKHVLRCVFLYGLIGWKTSKQEVVALSSTEAEYRSISGCCQDVCWLFELVSNFGLTLKARLFCDNQGALALLKNPLYQHRTRHIKLRLHWCRELLYGGFLEVKYVPTGNMTADILTKSLSRQIHNSHCKALWIVQGQYRAQGGVNNEDLLI